MTEPSASPPPGAAAVTADEAVDALRALTPQHRRVVHELALHRRAPALVAAETGWSTAEVLARLHAALRALAAERGQSPWPEQGSHAHAAAAVLGLLAPDAEARFAEHLRSCPGCRHELVGLRPAVSVLDAVQRHAAGPDGSRPPRAVTPRTVTPSTITPRTVATPPTGVVRLREDAARRNRRRDGRDERRARVAARPLLLLPIAATAGLLASGSVVTMEEIGLAPRWSEATRSADSGVRDVTATDPGTGATARMRLERLPSATGVTIWVTGVSGPRTCRLVAIGADGHADVLATVQVPPSGFGTRRQPDPLHLSVTTPRSGDEIRRVIVESLPESGPATTLVAATP